MDAGARERARTGGACAESHPADARFHMRFNRAKIAGHYDRTRVEIPNPWMFACSSTGRGVRGMKTNRARDASFDIKKWSFFLLFLIVLIVGFYFMLKPADQKRASQTIAEAEALTLQAREIAQTTNSPQDLANYDLAMDALEKARKLEIESELAAAISEAQKSATYARKVIRDTATANTVRTGNHITTIVGDVLVRVKGQFRTADQQITLGPGMLVKTTAENSGCELSFDNGMVVIMRPGTDLAIEESLDAADDTYRLSLGLESGAIAIETAESGKAKVQVVAEPGQAIFYRSAAGSVSIQGLREPTMGVRVLSGRVDVRSGTRSLILGPHQATSFTADLFNTQATELVQAPLLSAPPPFARFEANENGFASVALSWEKMTGAISYHVEMSTDPLFVQIHEERYGVIDNRLELPALRPGLYHWRVTSTSADNINGLPSDARQLEVVEEAGDGEVPNEGKPPTLIIDSVLVQGYMALVQGRTDRDAKVTINDENAILNKEDGTFSHALPFAGRGTFKIVIVAESSSGVLEIAEKSIVIKD